MELPIDELVKQKEQIQRMIIEYQIKLEEINRLLNNREETVDIWIEKIFKSLNQHDEPLSTEELLHSILYAYKERLNYPEERRAYIQKLSNILYRLQSEYLLFGIKYNSIKGKLYFLPSWIEPNNENDEIKPIKKYEVIVNKKIERILEEKKRSSFK